MSAQVILLVGQPPEGAEGLADAINQEPFVDALHLPTLDNALQFLDVVLPDVILVFADGFKQSHKKEQPTTVDATGCVVACEQEDDNSSGVAEVIAFCQQLRNDPAALSNDKHRPVLVVHSQTASENERLQYLIEGADDTLSQSLSLEEFRVRLLVQVRRNLEMQAHPVTRLPNLDVATKALQRWINLHKLEAERTWALTLIRMDYWQTYQEVYGEMATAQVMRTLAQLALQHIQPPDFLGHASETNTLILITPAPKAELVIKTLCREFDDLIPECYSVTDRKRGYLIAQTSERASRRIPLMSLSAGIVHSATQTGGNYRQAFSEATHLMGLAQRSHGSTWVADAVKLAGSTNDEAPKAPPRVLVVESDEALSMLLVATLEMQGYTVATATTPDAVLAEVTSTHTDLVLMDALLNDSEVGWELCQQIKALAPNTQVLLLATIHDRERALQCGADVYLPKPFDLFALFNTLEQLLR